jgi:drug/metabolite transporter (DMT)-like permease
VAAALALVAAAVFAFGTVLQQRVAMVDANPTGDASPALVLLRLARHPVWLAGIGAYLVGYLLQCAALGEGKLIEVQPMLATSIVFALPLGVWLSHQSIARRDVLAAIVVTVGLGLFLVLSDPGGGRKDAPTAEWLLAGGVILSAAAALALAARGRTGALRAAMLGTAAGLVFGLLSGLTKGAVELLEDEGFPALLGDWHLYAILGLGYVGMTLTQMSLAAGVLPPAVATTSIFNPAVGIVLGLALFDESIHRSALDSVAAALALLAMFGGVAVLAMGSQPARR